jgi:hypothetical protein
MNSLIFTRRAPTSIRLISLHTLTIEKEDAHEEQYNKHKHGAGDGAQRDAAGAQRCLAAQAEVQNESFKWGKKALQAGCKTELVA